MSKPTPEQFDRLLDLLDRVVAVMERWYEFDEKEASDD